MHGRSWQSVTGMFTANALEIHPTWFQSKTRGYMSKDKPRSNRRLPISRTRHVDLTEDDARVHLHSTLFRTILTDKHLERCFVQMIRTYNARWIDKRHSIRHDGRTKLRVFFLVISCKFETKHRWWDVLVITITTVKLCITKHHDRTAHILNKTIASPKCNGLFF